MNTLAHMFIICTLPFPRLLPVYTYSVVILTLLRIYILPFFPSYQVLCISISSTVLSLFLVGSSSTISLPIGFWVLCRSSKYLSTISFCALACSQLLLVFQHWHFQFECSTLSSLILRSRSFQVSLHRLFWTFFPYPGISLFHFQHQLAAQCLEYLFLRPPPPPKLLTLSSSAALRSLPTSISLSWSGDTKLDQPFL